MSLCNATTFGSRDVCNDKGICGTLGKKYVCECHDSWNSFNDCKTTVYQEVGVVHYIILMSVYAFQCLLVVLFLLPELVSEMIFDPKVSWKQPTIFGKTVFLIHCVCNSYGYIFQAWAAFNGTDPYTLSIFVSWAVAALCFGLSFALVVIGWITIVIQAKNLGKSTKAAKIFRLAAAIGVIILFFVYLISFVLVYLYLDSADSNKRAISSFFNNLTSTVSIVYVFALVAGSAYFVHQVFVWLRTLKDQTETLYKVYIKTIWIIVSYVSLGMRVIVLLIRLATGTSLTASVEIFLGYNWAYCIFNFFYLISYFMVLQRFTFHPFFGFLKSYRLVFTGRIHELETFSVFTKNPKKTHQTTESSKNIDTDKKKTTSDFSTASTLEMPMEYTVSPSQVNETLSFKTSSNSLEESQH